MVLNSRPLTYVSANDLEEPLTPSHLLIGRRVMSLPDPVSNDDSDDEVTVTLNRFWKHWKNEYLLELREAHRHHKGTDATPVEAGDIVVVHSDNQPRGFWKLARVERTITGRDGKIRGAAVRVANGQGRPTILHSPIQCLYQLEISFQERAKSQPNLPESDRNADSGKPDGDLDKVAVRRSNRAAASEARDRILAHSLDEN